MTARCPNSSEWFARSRSGQGFLFGGSGDERPNPLIAIGTMMLAPFAAMIVQFAISRSPEYVADREGAAICGDPLWLASALQRIETGVQRVPSHSAERHPATAPLFIVNPLAGNRIDNLFSTHPATANRVAALLQLAANNGSRSGAFSDARWAGSHSSLRS